MSRNNNPAHFVLVHGLGHGAWCWYKVRHLLESAGHKVSCVDLLASGIDPTPNTAVRSFDDYNRPLDDLLHSHDYPTQDVNDAKVILVGHSLGCRSLTRLLHDPRSPSILAAAVYIAGSMLRIRKQAAEELGLGSPDTSMDGVTRRPDGMLTEESQRLLFYGTSPSEDAVLASMLLRPAPPFSAIISWEPGEGHLEEPTDEVRRVYVKTNRDMTWKPWQQQKMIDLWPPSKVFDLDTDHSPFFSAPKELCDALLHVAADCGFS